MSETPAPHRVLIIDDSRTIRSSLVSLMKSFGFETFQAADGLEGLEKVKAEWPLHLALVDWEMPRMTGIEFVAAVRELPEYQEMKIMMVTTLNTFQQVAAALRAGADEFHMKPVARESLEAKLQLMDLLPFLEPSL
jgi:two-component system, chemotaxis family, chemotaxis protein CheY